MPLASCYELHRQLLLNSLILCGAMSTSKRKECSCKNAALAGVPKWLINAIQSSARSSSMVLIREDGSPEPTSVVGADEEDSVLERESEAEADCHIGIGVWLCLAILVQKAHYQRRNIG